MPAVPMAYSPSVGMVTRDGSDILIALNDTEGAFVIWCTDYVSLLTADGTSFRDERPQCGATPYFLDSVYVENPPGRTPCSVGCDGRRCAPLDDLTLPTVEYVQIGFRSANGADGAGGEGGGGGDSAVPDIETFETQGPYSLTVRYYEDDRCKSTRLALGPVVLDVE
jgi:hypothetical protein